MCLQQGQSLIFWLLCLLPVKLWAIAPLSPTDLLYRLSRASEQQSFQGSFSYQRSGDFATWRIWHQAPASEAGTVHERLLRLDGATQEVVRQGQNTQCISANLQGWPMLAHYHEQKLNVEDLRSAYDLHFADPMDARVAGHPVIVVRLTPQDVHRYALELSVEPETGILLKSLLLDEQGVLLERLQFLDFAAGVPPADDLTPSGACLPLPATEPQAPSQRVPWQVQWLPPAFHLKQSQNSMGLIQQTYSDGFAHFSVFVEPLQGGQGEEAQRQLGPTTVVSRRLLRAQGDWMVTVVGEIPQPTAERIALSIRPPPDSR